LWDEAEEAQELRQHEWATLRDLALLAGELDRRDREMRPGEESPVEVEPEGEINEFDDAAMLERHFERTEVEPAAPIQTEAATTPAAGEFAEAPLRCLEIGRGFGRLSDGMLHVFDGRATVTIVEADPVALAASYAYLTTRWPNLKAKICTTPLEARDFDTAEILIVPWWHLGDGHLTQRADFLADLSGFETLSDADLAAHLAVLETAAVPNALLYFMHSRDRLNPRGYAYSPTWHLRYKRRTPWSESPDHPAEVYLRSDRDCRAANRRTELAYLLTVVRQYRIERAAAQRTTERLVMARDQSRAKLAERSAALKKQQEQNVELALRIKRFNEELERTRLEAEQARGAVLELLDSAELSGALSASERARVLHRLHVGSLAIRER
jgi:hypothetical protein